MSQADMATNHKLPVAAQPPIEIWTLILSQLSIKNQAKVRPLWSYWRDVVS